MNLRTYRVKFEALTGESKTVLAKNFLEAATKAQTELTKLNNDLKESDDNRFPDQIASISLESVIDA